MPSPGVTHLGVSETGSFTGIWGLPKRLGCLPSDPQDPNNCLLNTGIPAHSIIRSFLHRFWKLNSDLHANTFPTEQIISSSKSQ